MTKTAVSLEHVSFHYPRRDKSLPPAIRDITLDIPSGQWVSIVGANGSGKSTLVKLINGLLPHNGGRIFTGGLELHAGNAAEIRQRVGFVFQNPDNQFVGATVEEDLAFGLQNRRLERKAMQERIARTAKQLDIAHLLHRHPSELSGGQKQRVAIAGALALEPDIIVFDEAASMLDECAKRQLIGLMRRLHASGKYTMIAVTHDEDEILASDRVIALADGTIVADEMPEHFYMLDDVVRQCRLRPPLYVQLSRELRKRGIDIGMHFREQTLLEELRRWAFDSMM